MAGVELLAAEPDVVPFASRIGTVFEYARYELTRRRLGAMLLGEPPQEVLAIGPESGLDALWLASQGHRVTVVDVDDQQTVRARRRINKWAPKLAERMNLKSQTLADIAAGDSWPAYGVVLSHQVAMHQKDPADLVYKLNRLVRPGGWLSVLEPGFYGSVINLGAQERYGIADNMERATRVMAASDADGWRFKPRWFIEVARAVGLPKYDWSGINATRHVDARSVDELTPAHLQAIVNEQDRVGAQNYLRGAAPFIHLTGRTQAYAYSSIKPPLW